MTTTDNGSGTSGQAAGAGNVAAAVAQGQTGQEGAARADAIQNGQGTFEVPAELLEWGKSKGYKPEVMAKVFAEQPDIYSMANSYRNAEKLLGGDKLVLPKDVSDQAGWDALYNKLGRPEKPDGYKLPLPEAATGEFSDWAKNTFHKVGVTQSQAEQLGAAWLEMMNGTIAKDEAEMKAAADSQRAALEKQWGADYKGNVEIATRATANIGKMAGIDGLDLDQMERAFGLEKSLKIMAAMGRAMKLDSDTFEGAADTTRGVGVKSIEAAKAEKEMLFKDGAFVKKYNENDSIARAKIAALNAVIAPSYGQ